MKQFILSILITISVHSKQLMTIDVETRDKQWVITITDENQDIHVYYYPQPVDRDGNVIQSKVDEIIATTKRKYLAEKNK